MTTTPPFASSTELRNLLHGIEAGTTSWHSPEAEELMTYSMTKYGALARKHGLEPADAAVAAFEVMRTRATREAADPWAVVTRAVCGSPRIVEGFSMRLPGRGPRCSRS